MKINQIHGTLQLLALSATLLLAAGCITPADRSYNQDFNQNQPTSPKYSIANIDDTHFHLTVHQGSPYSGPQRVIYMKRAASVVAATEAKRRGWPNWKLEYIEERDQGWMHILKADVTRENAAEMTPGSTR